MKKYNEVISDTKEMRLNQTGRHFTAIILRFTVLKIYLKKGFLSRDLRPLYTKKRLSLWIVASVFASAEIEIYEMKCTPAERKLLTQALR